LLDGNPGLVKKVYDCAMKAAAAVDTESIADGVFRNLNILDSMI
jgi:hypothetical protein